MEGPWRFPARAACRPRSRGSAAAVPPRPDPEPARSCPELEQQRHPRAREHRSDHAREGPRRRRVRLARHPLRGPSRRTGRLQQRGGVRRGLRDRRRRRGSPGGGATSTSAMGERGSSAVSDQYSSVTSPPGSTRATCIACGRAVRFEEYALEGASPRWPCRPCAVIGALLTSLCVPGGVHAVAEHPALVLPAERSGRRQRCAGWGAATPSGKAGGMSASRDARSLGPRHVGPRPQRSRKPIAACVGTMAMPTTAGISASSSSPMAQAQARQVEEPHLRGRLPMRSAASGSTTASPRRSRPVGRARIASLVTASEVDAGGEDAPARRRCPRRHARREGPCP
jgi:hypothetical protein